MAVTVSHIRQLCTKWIDELMLYGADIPVCSKARMLKVDWLEYEKLLYSLVQRYQAVTRRQSWCLNNDVLYLVLTFLIDPHDSMNTRWFIRQQRLCRQFASVVPRLYTRKQYMKSRICSLFTNISVYPTTILTVIPGCEALLRIAKDRQPQWSHNVIMVSVMADVLLECWSESDILCAIDRGVALVTRRKQRLESLSVDAEFTVSGFLEKVPVIRRYIDAEDDVITARTTALKYVRHLITYRNELHQAGIFSAAHWYAYARGGLIDITRIEQYRSRHTLSTE